MPENPNRRRFLRVLGTGAAAAATGCAAPGLLSRSWHALTDTRPNFIVIFTDDQGYGDLGIHGAEGFETPNLDRMAAEGRDFTDFYVAAPVCTPSRAALLTGCHPVRVGLGHRVLFPFSDTGLNTEEVTIAELLKPRGYATACIGKWHLGHHAKFMPRRQGFDYYYGVPYSNDMNKHYYKHLDFRSPPLPLYRNEEVIESDPDQGLLTKRYTEEAVRFIEAHRDEPFFLYLPHNMPHLPIHASPDFKGKSELGLYGDVIQEIDWSVGQILKTLSRLELDQRTLVIFTSDNGPWRRESAGPLRGHKNTTWEGGMREPCIMRWPGHVPAGTTCRELATTMDLLPTFCRLAGAEPPHDRIIDGKDIWPLISGQADAQTPHEAFYYYRDERLQAVRAGRWKLHVHRPEWKDQPHAPLLYDLEADVGEKIDVAAQHPEIVKRLEVLAERARQDLGDKTTQRTGSNVRPVGQL